MPVSAQKSRLLVGDFHLTSYATQVGTSWQQDILDTTVLTDAAKTAIIGGDTSTLKMSGYYDLAEHADLASWESSTAQPVTWAPNGLAIGSEVWLQNALLSEFSSNAARNGVAGWDLGGQTDGLTDFGVSLHNLGAETADGSAASNDGTAATTAGAVAHLHVTAFSGFSGAVVTIEDSANDSTWATIGTFTTVAGVTGERITIAGTVRRYTRATVDVTGTGSVTYAVALARR